MGFRDDFTSKNPIKQTASGSSGSGNKTQELSYFDQFKANIVKNINPYGYKSDEATLADKNVDNNWGRVGVSSVVGTKEGYETESNAIRAEKKETGTDDTVQSYFTAGHKLNKVKDVATRVIETGLGNKEEMAREGYLAHKGTAPEDWNKIDKAAEHERRDLMSIMMGTPQEFNSIGKSQYKPSNSTDENATYYKSQVTEDTIRENYKSFIQNMDSNGTDKVLTYQAGDNIRRDKVNRNVLGRFTVGKGIDDDGREYLSYYDKWDLQPFKKSSNLLTSVTDKLQYLAGIEAPEVYGRIYKDELGDETWQDQMENRNNQDE